MANDTISRKAAIEAIGKVPDYGDGMVFEAISHAQRDVALLPSVDAVLVVRCRDCNEYQRIFHWCKLHDGEMQPDDFCSYGERREE